MGLFQRWFNREVVVEPEPEVEPEPSGKTELEQELDRRQYVTKITIGMKPDGDVEVYMNWKDGSEAVAELSATLLFEINNGGLQDTFIDVVTECSKSDVSRAGFVKKILDSWNAMANEPLIHPTEVIKGPV